MFQLSLLRPTETMASYLVLLLLLSGDVELNPGPPKRAEPKPDPKKVMEDKVNGHDEKIEALEKLVEEQGKMLLEMTEKQVELIQQVEKDKVELNKKGEEIKVFKQIKD